jgi:hypothetical protein
MVSHLVLLKPRADLATADRDRLVTAFEHAIQGISTVRHVHVGRRVTHGAGYETQMPAAEYLVTIDFDDLAGLQGYLRHPAHAELADRFGESLASALVYDFEDIPLEKLREEAAR